MHSFLLKLRLIVLFSMASAYGMFALDITTTTPASNANNISASANIVINFDGNVDGATVNSTNIRISGNLTSGITTAGSFSGGGTSSITFDPTSNFEAGELITVTVTVAILEVGTGTPLTADYTFLFNVASTATFFTPKFTEATLTSGFLGAHGSYPADIDLDGDMDIAAVAMNDNELRWFSNDGNQVFTDILIDASATRAYKVHVADLDSDGDMDIVTCSHDPGTEVNWYDNNGSQSFTKKVVATEDDVRGVFVEDLDGDGDMDVLVADFNGNEIIWYANDGSQNFSANTIGSGITGANWVHVADMDKDGDLDVLGVARTGNKISWFDNNGSQTFVEKFVDNTSIGTPTNVHPVDMDNDGDMDLVASIHGNSDVVWYENDGSQTFGASSKKTIDAAATFANFAVPGDMDGDGDLDVVSANFIEDTYDWYENDGSQNFTEHNIASSIDGAAEVKVADIDGDGDLDIVGSSYITAELDWYENEKIEVSYNGSTWSGGSGTGGALGSGDGSKATLIQGSVTLTESGTSDNLRIANGATVTVNPGVCLRVNTEISNAGGLILNANASDYAQYIGPAVRATVNQQIDSEGWHNIGSPFSNAAWDSLSLNSGGLIQHPQQGSSQTSCDTCNLWYYDASTDNGTNIGGSGDGEAYGTWRSSASGSESFSADKGWSLYLDNTNFGTAPWTLTGTATLRSGQNTQNVNENNKGWNLVSNPFASVIDWDAVDNDLAAAGIKTAYYVWDHANSAYATYDGGIGTLSATRYIAPFQGFYVQTSTVGGQNSGDVIRSFTLENSDRPSSCETAGNDFYKRASNADKIVLKTTVPSSGKIDETILVFDQNHQSSPYNNAEDVVKLMDYSPASYNAAAVYSFAGTEKCAINRLPMPSAAFNTVNLGIKSGNNNLINLEVPFIPNGWKVYIKDLLNPNALWFDLSSGRKFTFNQQENYPDRFILYFTNTTVGLEDLSVVSNYQLFYKDNDVYISIVEEDKMKWTLYSLSGQIMSEGIFIDETSKLPSDGLADGAYLLELKSSKTGIISKEKIVLY